MTLEYALCKVSPIYFRTSAQEAELALRSMQDASEILKVIVEGKFQSAAGRLIGAYRFLNQPKMADDIKKGVEYAGMRVDETNPFDRDAPFLRNEPFVSPYVARIRAMWEAFREIVVQHFPVPPGLPRGKKSYLKAISEIYTQDAYNSLSIEGYQVTEGLIERVRRSEWNPVGNHDDAERYNALAARGYYEAHHRVEDTVQKILEGEDPGKRVADDLQQWYQGMFSPMVSAGIISASDLFRATKNTGIHSRLSLHTSWAGVRQAVYGRAL